MIMNRLIIVGASGHGKVVADIAKLNGYEDIVFLDDNKDITEFAGRRVIGTSADLKGLDGDVFIAIGNADTRKKLMEENDSRSFPVLIHPSAVTADDVTIGRGSVLMAGTVVNPGTRIGVGCIINTCSSVDHDCVIEDYVHISVGSHLSGTVTVGEGTWIGAGVTVSNNIDICGGCIIGAGAVVIRNTDTAGTYVGVPAHLI